VDIPTTLNLLLGRPWLLEHQTTPSTLQQKVKIFIKGQVVIIEGDNLFATINKKRPVLKIECKHDKWNSIALKL